MKNVAKARNSAKELSNSLIYTTDKVIKGEHIYVKIRLNDECKNGHQDFSITGDIYQAGKPKADKYHICGGCIHEDIEKAFPEFKQFINLHLCDYLGNPMHFIANGFYHLKNQNWSIDKFAKYYRVSIQEAEALSHAYSKTHFAIIFSELKISKKWAKEASEAIKTLEGLTGKTFLIDSKRTQLIMPTPEEIAEEKNRINSGYYSPEAIKQRNVKEGEAILKKAIQSVKEKIQLCKLEIKVLKAVFNAGGAEALDNCIFYNHTKQLAFNWRGYDSLSEEKLSEIKNNLKLPEGVTIK